MAEMSHLVTKKNMVHGTPRGQSIDSKTSPGTSNRQEYSPGHCWHCKTLHGGSELSLCTQTGLVVCITDPETFQ